MTTHTATLVRGDRMPYAALCECGHRTQAYAAQHAAMDMHAAHLRQVQLADAIAAHTGADPLGVDADAFQIDDLPCSRCQTWTATALVVDDEDGQTEVRSCLHCIQW